MSQMMAKELERGPAGREPLASPSREQSPRLGSPPATPSLEEAHPEVAIRRGTARTEQQLMERVFERCHGFILAASQASSVPAEFLGALTANESGGNPHAVRFEPAVYRHLKAVAGGQSPRWGGIRREELATELGEVLHPKAGQFHAHYLSAPFAARHAAELGSLTDEALRELASSWGFTQIMGFHMVGRPGTVRDLREPNFHFRLATQLLAEFAQDYQLDLTCEYEELFRCWNTGQPYGTTKDPAYVVNGLRRMAIYKRLIEPSGDRVIEPSRRAG